MSIKPVLLLILTLLLLQSQGQEKPINAISFAQLNLDYPGLEKVRSEVKKGRFNEAATKLLQYYRNIQGIRHLEFNKEEAKNYAGKKVNEKIQQLADDILLHKFKPHKSYPTYDYGQDINWQYRPVQDQLVTTFLHRTAFWEPLGLVYRATGDERYAREWVLQVRDWIKKNPQGAYPDDKDYAWKAFVVSFRLNHWSGFLNLFINSPQVTPAFLLEFLNSYGLQANYVMANYTDVGNHLLYEALHLMVAGSNFPELKNAPEWRKSGIEVLSKEIEKQVLPDGMQFELSTSYHIGTIKTFLDALQIAQLAGLANEFSNNYKSLVEKMVTAVGKFSFPDYRFPLYGNSFLTTKPLMLKNYQTWAKVFPANKEIQFFATEGAAGERPNYLSSALPNAGFYAFRSGWDSMATVMQIKAGPPAEFHSHPDNGNFVLWVKGRDFTPDAGSFIYANVGGQENAKRDWYRSTKAHQTLTLNNANLTNNAKLNKWQTGTDIEVLSYTNPSYTGLNHQRSFLFIDKSFFIIIDNASGDAKGKLGVHFNLKEDSKPIFDKQNNKVSTNYKDGNNLLIQSLNADGVIMTEEESHVSYEYQKEQPRPAFVFEKQKTDANISTFVSVVYPYSNDASPIIKIQLNKGNNWAEGKIDFALFVDGKQRNIKLDL